MTALNDLNDTNNIKDLT